MFILGEDVLSVVVFFFLVFVFMMDFVMFLCGCIVFVVVFGWLRFCCFSVVFVGSGFCVGEVVIVLINVNK